MVVMCIDRSGDSQSKAPNAPQRKLAKQLSLPHSARLRHNLGAEGWCI